MITWIRNNLGDIISSNTEHGIINISGSLSSSYPPHAYWITMYDKYNIIIHHDCKTTEDECKQLAEEWINKHNIDLFTESEYDKEN